MINNFIFSINSVLPVFLIIVFGLFLGKKKIVTKEICTIFNKIVFNYALPLMLFRNISSSDFNSLLDIKLILFAVISTIITFFTIWIGASIFLKDKKAIGAFVQGSFRTNYAIIGIPLITSIIGKPASKAAIITAFVIPIYNVLSVIVLTVGHGEKINKIIIKKSATEIFNNPLIRGIFIALPFAIFNIKLPNFITSTVDYMANLTTPLALISIGATLNIKDAKKSIKYGLIGTSIKLVITPLIFMPIAIYLGFTGESLITLFIMLGASTAISSYVMVCNMKGDENLASNIVILTTVLSSITVTVGVYIFKSLNLI